MKYSVFLRGVILFFVFISVCYGFHQNRGGNYKLIIFEGSDWCENCIRFEKNILADTLFLNFVDKNNIEIERIDFPQRKKIDMAVQKYNESIAEKYSFKGVFPTIYFVKPETGEVLSINYDNQTTKEFLVVLKTKMYELN